MASRYVLGFGQPACDDDEVREIQRHFRTEIHGSLNQPSGVQIHCKIGQESLAVLFEKANFFVQSFRLLIKPGPTASDYNKAGQERQTAVRKR